VHHGHRALALGGCECPDDLSVIQLQIVIGHIDLERGHPLVRHQPTQLWPDNLLGRVAENHVKRVIDQSLAGGALVVIGEDIDQALTPELAGERNDRGGAARRCGRRPRTEIVRTDRAIVTRLVNMAMRVDPARCDQTPTRVDLPTTGCEQ
jgi:hypothetical protein